MILEELKTASLKHPPIFNSNHESYAVLLEEVEECKSALDFIERDMKVLWSEVKNDANNKELLTTLREMEKIAKNLVEESIQVGAMIEKFKRFLND